MEDKLLKKTPHKALFSADPGSEAEVRKVWLAGLGALAITEQEGSDLFQRLVKRGKELEKVRGVAVVGARNVTVLLETQKAASDTAAVRQARRNERVRRAFLKEFGSPWNGKAEHELWEREGRIFTVDHEGTKHVPLFQFDKGGQPRPAVAGVIRALGGKTSNWGLALWLTANSGWLGGRRPVDLLNSEPERVVQAAESEASELVF
jgi:poly(hydroxyalkanoate) granule-associated protein